ncbi:hypothetical protein FP744_10002295 [Trichoderma asperellum]
MPFTKEKREAYEKLRKKYGIEFIDDLPGNSWPEPHREIFQSIKELANIKYDEYVAQQNSDGFTAFWRQESKSRARRLIEKAKDCVDRNEATWRFACEPLVFSRFTAEIAWEERVGLNKLFIDRAEETVFYPSQLQEELKDIKRPDRIYGLRSTRNFENLLSTRLSDDNYVGDLLPDPPVSSLGEELLFPFLALESKKAASEDWTSICLQTAFPIYAFLNFQRSLQQATASRSKWTSEPLVWFFASRGEEWRLYTAYQHQKHPTLPLSQAQHTTNIVLMWKGSITIRDDALQLLLLVDYICDWARDVYRPAILKELGILANADTDIATVITDTDIFSSRERLVPQIGLDIKETDPESRSDEHETLSLYQQLDSQYGAVRHASMIQSRFLCIFITDDNVQTFLRSMNEKTKKIVTRKILNLINSSTKASKHVLSGDALNNIENAWSGHSRPGMPFNVSQAKFITILQLNYYMSTKWEQVRDLCVISVSENAFGALISGSGLIPGRGKAKQPSLSACNQDQDAVIGSIRQVWNSSAQETLLAAISRVSCCVTICDSDERSKNDLLTHCEPTIWELVNYTYKLHKPGDIEPNESFLRISKQRNKQQIDSANQGLFKFENNLNVSPQSGVLIHGLCHRTEGLRTKTSLCLYLFRSSTEPPSKTDIGMIIKETFENFDVYHTTRDNGNLNLRDQKIVSQIWNLKEVYGLHFSYGHVLGGKCSFLKWVEYLQCPVPTRQGSPRGPNDCGRIYTREYSPWHDPRLTYGGGMGGMRHRYIMKVVAGEARDWSLIAIKRQREGINCCRICARPKEPASRPNGSRIFLLDDLCCGPCFRGVMDITEDGFQKWFKLLVFSGNEIGYSTCSGPQDVPIDPPTEGYDMRTPPPPPHFGGMYELDTPDARAILNGSLDVDTRANQQHQLSSENWSELSSEDELSSQGTRKRRRLN